MLPGVLDLIGEGVVPGGTASNAEYAEQFVDWAPEISPELRIALTDAQTSGGLLIAVAPQNLDALTEALRSAGALAEAVVGQLVEGTPGHITVTEGFGVGR
jgi:selenide,water dikinase